MGAPLTGRGLIQIWCLLNFSITEGNVPYQVKRMRKQNPSQSTTPHRRRGRPRKKPVSETEDDLDVNSKHADAAADSSSETTPPNDDEASGKTRGLFGKRYSGRKRRSSSLVVYQASEDCSVVNKSSKDPNQNSSDQNPNSSDSEKTDIDSPQPKKARGRPKKKLRDEPQSQNVQPLAVQAAQSSSTLTHKNEVSGTMNVQVVRESVKNSDLVASVQLHQSPGDDDATEVKLLESKKARGRPKSKAIVVAEDQLTQAVAIRSSNLIPLYEHGTIEQEVVIRGSGRKQNVSKQVFATGPKQISSIHGTEEAKLPQPKKKRGRPKKKPRDEAENEHMQALAVEFPESMLPGNDVSGTVHEKDAEKESHRNQNSIERNRSSLASLEAPLSCRQEPVGQLSENGTRSGLLKMYPARSSNPKDAVLPRAVLCLAHNGKVAWDVKWQPSDSYGANPKHRMGYLAVLLGNGALEV